MTKKVRRNFYIPELLDKALWHAAIDTGSDKSDIVAKALDAYLPGISSNPAVVNALNEAKAIAS